MDICICSCERAKRRSGMFTIVIALVAAALFWSFYTGDAPGLLVLQAGVCAITATVCVFGTYFFVTRFYYGFLGFRDLLTGRC